MLGRQYVPQNSSSFFLYSMLRGFIWEPLFAMVNTKGNMFYKFLTRGKCDRDFIDLFEMSLNSVKVVQGSVNDNNWTDYVEMNFEINGPRMVNIET